MGTQSSLNPNQERVRGKGVTLVRLLRNCQVACLAIGVAARLIAQTPAVTLPLVLPSAIAFDAQGNLFIADTGDNVVRKLSTSGTITTFAGTGVQGFSGDNGPASSAQLDSPGGIAIDASGNLYISDSHNHRIREVIAGAGTIISVAGAGKPGYSGDGGLARDAAIDLPTALAEDSAGNLYIADTNNHRIRRIAAATGIITTVAGNGRQGFSGDNGPATSAAIDSPSGLAVDAAGNLYLADTHNARVREVNAATGLISTLAGGASQPFGGDGGPATTAGLALPRSLTMDSAGNLYIADSSNQRIRRISPSGTITTVAGEGTQTFAGDGGPAVTASLDTPQSVAVSPDGLLTLADTGNKRVRQLDSVSNPGPDIRTITGIGNSLPGSLSLAGPSVVAYGSGSVTATMTAGALATGSVTFLEVSGTTPITLGSVALNPTGSATFSVALLAAGTHRLAVVYPGDSTHAAAQSSTLTITITPLAAIATANPASMLYGQPVPALTGTLTGILAQDARNITVAFASSAAALSAPGAYPVTATLTGAAATNYTLSVVPSNLTIAQAPSVASLSSSSSNPAVGSPVTLTATVRSTTNGMPTGTVALMDGTNLLNSAPLPSAGNVTFNTSSFTLGTHSLTAVYSGDVNFLPSTSAVSSVVVGADSDFTLTPTGVTSQSVPAGTSATFNFSVATQGAALASPIILAVQGLPMGATASFTPATISPGATVSGFALTIQTPHAALDRPRHPGSPPAGLPVILAIAIPAMGLGRRDRQARFSRQNFVCLTLCAAFALLVAGCGNRVNTAPELTTAATYTLTVTGTSTSLTGSALQHTATVTLQIL